jgi:pimeloyl-ACP methyl ester carboxylesterase
MAERGFVDVEGGRLAFEADGEGPVVTLLHPGLWDMRTWDSQFAQLPELGFRAIRYDVRGSGGSSRIEAPYSNVRDLIALLDALDITETAVVGCSLGGAISIDTTLEHPDRVWALVPVASGLGGLEWTEEEEDRWEGYAKLIMEAVEAGDLRAAQDIQLIPWVPLGTDDPAGKRIREIALENLDDLTADESLSEELDPPAARRLGDIDVPTLVILAEMDPPMLHRAADLIATGIIGARKITIEGADHVVNLRKPQEFDEAVFPFLSEVRP